ncbi:CRP/FNR family transcriptional regulator, anaerobic regulatory protein [Sulfitobacter marinus]|uniref:CRP/FNR family transcriptional regulator, anaerobic regulatory protein n=1 Tax=Sulfitobacter marinus TaxID=394264 RepID=A0A1I6VHF8_9RHOB|nr:Crp/Fnr family transcriptional regulator [Sulfitobacter marinus]SFT13089.1 CRP/FNR family transcriptional regulator, anaerobic regulatory protein [Sulfitobacter marinus]
MTIELSARVTCTDCPIRHRAVCAYCTGDELDVLEQLKSYKTFKAGEPILWRADKLTYVGSLVHGVATLSKTLEDGRTQMVGLLLPSDFIGRPGRSEIEFDVVAVTDVTLCCFQIKPFEALIASTPHVAQRLVEMALDELDVAREWMLLLGRKTAREKIATFVQMLVQRQHIAGTDLPGQALSLPLTQEQIANYLGLTLETVSRQLGIMKKNGILRFSDRRHFEVIDFPALQLATGDDSDGGVLV